MSEIKNLIGKTLSVRDTQECHNCDTVIADVQFKDNYYQFLDDDTQYQEKKVIDNIAYDENAVDEMAKHAIKEGNPLYPVPRLLDANDLATILRIAHK